jgi:hypothetical protein
MSHSNLRGEFFGNPIVQYIDGNSWRLLQLPEDPFFMRIYTSAGYYDIKPEDSFVFDFASIPMPMRMIFPKTGGRDKKYGRSAVIHDWGYSYPGNITRHTWDKIFLLGMEIDNCSLPLRSLFYNAVRAGGSKYFGKPNELNRLRGL